MISSQGQLAILIAIFAVLMSGGAGASEEPGTSAATVVEPLKEGELEELLERVDSPDFNEREEAMLRLWKAGRGVEESLRELEPGLKDPEKRLRVRRIIDKFDFGIYPDTPAEIIGLINQFRDGSEENQRGAITELSARNEFKLAIRLIRTLKDHEVRNRLSDSFARAVDGKIEPLIIGEKLDEAGELLLSCAVNRQRMIDFAAFASIRGGLKIAIADQRKQYEASNDLISGELLYWLLRADGRAKDALELAESMARPDLAREARILSGDLLTFVDASADMRLNTVPSHAYALARHRLSGDTAKAATAVKTLQKFAVEFDNEFFNCAIALGLNGYVEEAFGIVEEHNPPQLCIWHLTHDNIDKALAFIGLEEGTKDAKKIGEALGKKLSESKSTYEKEEWIAVSADFARLFGDSEKAVSLLDFIFETVLAKDRDLMQHVIRKEALLGLPKEARRHAVRALEEGLKEEVIVDALFPESERAAFSWYMFLKSDGGFPSAKPETLFEWMRWLLHPEESKPEGAELEKVEEIISLAEKTKLDAAAWPNVRMAFNDPVGGLDFRSLITEVCRKHKMWDRALGHILADRPVENWLKLAEAGELHAQMEKWKEAEEYFKKAWEADASYPSNLFLQGWAMANGGDEKGGEELMRKARLLIRGDLRTRIALTSRGLLRFGMHSLAVEEMELVYRLSNPLDEENTSATVLLEILLARSDPARAEYLTERRLLEEMKGGVRATSNFLYFLNRLYGVQTRAALARKDGRAALTAVEKALAFSPSNSSAMEDAYFPLVELGFEKEANAHYDGIHRKALTLTKRYPDYAQFHNNLAWLDSRCGKRLDEALEHAEMAVSTQPDSAAYLDTLAEVHYARGEHAKAVHFSDKCLDLLPTDVQIREQNAKFRAALSAQRGKPEAGSAPTTPSPAPSAG